LNAFFNNEIFDSFFLLPYNFILKLETSLNPVDWSERENS
jgi:hypothetical protein